MDGKKLFKLSVISFIVVIMASVIKKFIKKRMHVKKHGTPPGTYEINMEDWT